MSTTLDALKTLEAITDRLVRQVEALLQAAGSQTLDPWPTEKQFTVARLEALQTISGSLVKQVESLRDEMADFPAATLGALADELRRSSPAIGLVTPAPPTPPAPAATVARAVRVPVRPPSLLPTDRPGGCAAQTSCEESCSKGDSSSAWMGPMGAVWRRQVERQSHKRLQHSRALETLKADGAADISEKKVAYCCWWQQMHACSECLDRRQWPQHGPECKRSRSAALAAAKENAKGGC
eukprot:gnl/TRDRNA2_/TRDRNA2_39264_c0_seq1.p1 gnl/TRDRNA2_/TRDRNA2_39264_c0~~gnl/TRDRNA2_/TRDRNA2_39264_c0_seq1.p1  ORF type:complete len:239 (-),score=44.19 gnl/TRDRNA2_/TRDRNA2_39264_c0_seq1:211-927(-)